MNFQLLAEIVINALAKQRVKCNFVLYKWSLPFVLNIVLL